MPGLAICLGWLFYRENSSEHVTDVFILGVIIFADMHKIVCAP